METSKQVFKSQPLNKLEFPMGSVKRAVAPSWNSGRRPMSTSPQAYPVNLKNRQRRRRTNQPPHPRDWNRYPTERRISSQTFAYDRVPRRNWDHLSCATRGQLRHAIGLLNGMVRKQDFLLSQIRELKAMLRGYNITQPKETSPISSDDDFQQIIREVHLEILSNQEMANASSPATDIASTNRTDADAVKKEMKLEPGDPDADERQNKAAE